MLFIFAAFLSGVTSVASRMINARLSDRVGAMRGSFINHVSGLIVSFLLVAALGSLGELNMPSMTLVPWWGYLGGLFGVLVVALSNYVAVRASALIVTMLVFAGQLLSGAAIDYFLFDTFSMGKPIGGLVLLAGLYLCMREEKEVAA